MVIRLLMLPVGTLKLTVQKAKTQEENGSRLLVNNRRTMSVAKSIMHSLIVL